MYVSGTIFDINKTYYLSKKKKKNNLVNMNNEAIRPPIQAMSRKGKKLSLALNYSDYVTENLKKIRKSTINERSIISSN